MEHQRLFVSRVWGPGNCLVAKGWRSLRRDPYCLTGLQQFRVLATFYVACIGKVEFKLPVPCPIIFSTMTKFIELTVAEDDETKTLLVNMASIGRVFPNPQNSAKSIVELNYQSINDAPVYLEVEMSFEKLKTVLL